MKCTECKKNYYPKKMDDNTINCYPANNIQNNYHFDKSIRALQSDCHRSCASCLNSNYGSCLTCNETYFYYPLEDMPSFCREKDEAINDGYLYDNDNKVLKKCYYRCKSCYEVGVDGDNKCSSCRDSYFKYEDECLIGCPEELYRFGYNCVHECDEIEVGYFKDFFSRTCKSDCPSGTKKIITLDYVLSKELHN
jgi:hypothetical protein